MLSWNNRISASSGAPRGRWSIILLSNSKSCVQAQSSTMKGIHMTIPAGCMASPSGLFIELWKKRALRSLPAWRQAGHHTTTHRRSSRLFPGRVFYLAGDPTKGRLCVCSCDDEQTIDSPLDLCKSGGFNLKKINGFRYFSASQQAYRS